MLPRPAIARPSTALQPTPVMAPLPKAKCLDRTSEKVKRLCAPTPTRAPELKRSVVRSLENEFESCPAYYPESSLVYSSPQPARGITPHLTPVVAPSTPPKAPKVVQVGNACRTNN